LIQGTDTKVADLLASRPSRCGSIFTIK
jgi:hypothetical protein